jgi:hypothetical protein
LNSTGTSSSAGDKMKGGARSVDGGAECRTSTSTTRYIVQSSNRPSSGAGRNIRSSDYGYWDGSQEFGYGDDETPTPTAAAVAPGRTVRLLDSDQNVSRHKTQKNQNTFTGQKEW